MRFLYVKIPFTCVRVSLAAFVMAAALFYADFSVFTAIVLISAAIHEAGHLTALSVLGAKIYGVTVLPFGAVIRSDAERLPYAREAAVALAGALFNFAAGLSAEVFYLLHHDMYSLFFCASNFFLAAVNLIPVRTLDGGRALEAMLYAKLPPEKAERYAESVSYIAFVVLTFAALAMLAVTGCNFSLIVLCVYLFLCVYAKR